MSAGHALLGASGSKKWLNCPPSARLEETLPESQSVYADEGRLAHEIGELKLRKAFVEPMSTRAYNAKLKKLQEDPLYLDEMLRYTDNYADYVSSVVHACLAPPYVAIEKRLDYSHIVPEGFGTGDVIIISGSTLHVIDLKYGKGVPVSAVENSQMQLYALAALHGYSMIYAIDTVKMVIIQPRLDSISEFEMSAADLIAWGDSIKDTAQMAYNGDGEFNPGEHCRFCRAKALCRKRTDDQIALEAFAKALPPLITNDEVGSILARAQELSAWVKALEEYALSEILKGNAIAGWKAVAGRATRQFTDSDKVFDTLQQNGIPEAVLYERKPITLTAIEALLGKPKFKELLTPYVNTPPGKPTLAVLSDKRVEFTNNQSAKDAFTTEVKN